MSGVLVGSWRFGGLFEWYLMELSMGSIEGPFGNSVGVSLARRSSGWWGGVLFVSLELRRFLAVFACGGVFSPFSTIS